MKDKEFDCVQMTRSIRNELYEKNKNASIDTYIANIINEAHKSRLWKSMKKVPINRK